MCDIQVHMCDKLTDSMFHGQTDQVLDERTYLLCDGQTCEEQTCVTDRSIYIKYNKQSKFIYDGQTDHMFTGQTSLLHDRHTDFMFDGQTDLSCDRQTNFMFDGQTDLMC